jgi:AcrR family transcriptional regulator
VPRTGRARRAYHHGDLHRALVAAATALLDRRGPGGVTLRGTARAAGVSQAAPYRHFASKEALLASVAEAAFHALRQACEAAAPKSKGRDPVAWLDAVATAYVRFAVAHPARYRLMWAPTPRGRDYPALHSAASAAGAALAGALAACSGSADAADRPVEHLLVLWSLLHGLVGLILDEQLPHEILKSVPIEILAQTAMRVLREGLSHGDGKRASRRAG